MDMRTKVTGAGVNHYTTSQEVAEGARQNRLVIEARKALEKFKGALNAMKTDCDCETAELRLRAEGIPDGCNSVAMVRHGSTGDTFVTFKKGLDFFHVEISDILKNPNNTIDDFGVLNMEGDLGGKYQIISPEVESSTLPTAGSRPGNVAHESAARQSGLVSSVPSQSVKDALDKLKGIGVYNEWDLTQNLKSQLLNPVDRGDRVILETISGLSVELNKTDVLFPDEPLTKTLEDIIKDSVRVACPGGHQFVSPPPPDVDC